MTWGPAPKERPLSSSCGDCRPRSITICMNGGRLPPPTPKPTARSAQIEHQALARRVVTRTDGLGTMGAHWIIPFFNFVFARPPAENAPAGALGRRMDHALTGELRTGLRVLIVAAV